MKIYEYRNQLVKTAPRLTARKIEGGGYVAAGYPAEAYNYIEPRLDLNKYILRNKRYNRCVWATNAQMYGEGIVYGDLIAIDKRVPWKPDSVGLYWIEDEFSLRREIHHPDRLELVSLNPVIRPYYVEEGERFERIGIATHVVKKWSNYRNNYGGLPDNVETLVRKGMDYTNYIIPKDHESATFYLWAWGESMSGDGIATKDLLVIDNTLEVHEDSILVFRVDGRFTLKRVVRGERYNELVSSNPAFPPIRIRKGDELQRISILNTVVKNIYDQQEYEIFHPL